MKKIILISLILGAAALLLIFSGCSKAAEAEKAKGPIVVASKIDTEGALPIIALAVIADRSMFVLTALITPKGLKV